MQITREFMACEVKQTDQLRFKVGDIVWCRVGGPRGGPPTFKKGSVIKVCTIVFAILTKTPSLCRLILFICWQLWDEGNPYRVRTVDGELTHCTPCSHPTTNPFLKAEYFCVANPLLLVLP